MQGGAIPWQNVQFVKKAYITEIMSAILIEDPTKYGNQTSNVWAVKLTEYHRNYMFVLPALDLVKLRELSKLFKDHRNAMVLFLSYYQNCMFPLTKQKRSPLTCKKIINRKAKGFPQSEGFLCTPLLWYT